MPEQVNNIPEPIANAQRALKTLRAEGNTIPAALEKRINAMAIRLDQTGEDISPETLQWHIKQGEDHIKNIGRSFSQSKQITPMERYKTIIKSKTDKKPEPDLSHIEWNYEQARDYIKNERYNPIHICKSLLEKQRHDIIKALHDDGVIQTDDSPSVLLVSALEIDDTRTLRFIHQKSDNLYEHDGYSFLNAAENGSLECLKYLLEHYTADKQTDDISTIDMCAYVSFEKDRLGIYNYLNNNHPVREDMNRHIAIQAIEENRPDFALKAIEYQNANEQTLQLFLGAAAQKNNLELYKTIQQHFNVPAFSTLNDKEEYPLQQFIPVVIGNGHIDMARHIMAEAPELPLRTYNVAMDVASMTGKIDGLRYLVEEQDIFDKLDEETITAFMYDTGPLEHWEAYEYLNERYAAHYPDAVPRPLPEEVTTLIDRWQNTLHINPPPGLTECTPIGLKTKTYSALKEILCDEIDNCENDEDDNAHMWQQMINTQHGFSMAVYKLSRLFGTANRALDYMEKWGDFEKNQPLRQLANQIRIPLTESFNAKAWGDAALKHGPEMGKLAEYAHKLRTPPTMTKSRTEMAKRVFSCGRDNPEFAALCIDLNVPEEQFNLSLKIWSELKMQGFPEKNLPDITIDGEAFESPGTQFHLMKNDDIRGFILGHYLDCCQHIMHENGGMPTLHGMSSENGGFYCIEDENENIIGAIWAWRGKNDELVFDSLENSKGQMNKEKWHKVLTAFTEELQNTPSDIPEFLVAVDSYGKLEEGTYKETGIPATPKDYAEDHYRDSQRQLEVWTANPEKLKIYNAVGDEDQKQSLQELVQRLFPDNIYAYESEEGAPPEDATPDKEQLNKTLLAYKNDDLVGFANIRHMESYENKNGFYLEFLGVDPGKTTSMARHQVVAKLLEAIEHTVQNAPRTNKTVHFLTHEDNTTVQRGVTAIGFEYNDREENYFNDGKAALAYSIDLSKQSLIHNMKAKRAHCPDVNVTASMDVPVAAIVQIWEPGL